MWLIGLKIDLFLWNRCEKGVMSSVNVRNCIRFYQTAEELNAATLMNYCGEIIASHWVSTHFYSYFLTDQTYGFSLVCIITYDAVNPERPQLSNFQGCLYYTGIENRSLLSPPSDSSAYFSVFIELLVKQGIHWFKSLLK